jgi:hypothetical protein
VKLIQGKYRYANAHDMYALLGVKSLPVEGMGPRLIQGVMVYVNPLNQDAFELFMAINEPSSGWADLAQARRAYAKTNPRRNFQGLRVMAICDCGQHVPVGRMHQHKCVKQVRS